MSTEVQEEKKDEGKVQKQFESNVKKLVAVLGGKENLRQKKRIKTDALTTVVAELLKEESEATVLDVKENLKKLLQNHVSLEKEVAAKEDELKKLKELKMKEFNEAAKKLFDRIEGLDDREKEYYKALEAAGTATQS